MNERRFGLSSLFLLAFVLVGLSACGSSEKEATVKGTRIAVMPDAHKPTADKNLEGFQFDLPEPAVNPAWPQCGGTTDHAPGNLALSLVPEKVWSHSIGSGSSGDYKLLAKPIIADNRVFAQDAKGYVSAYDLAEGDRLWRVDTAPPDRDGSAMGGGIAYDHRVVYASTGFGEIVALSSDKGSVLWRRMIGKPIRSAPTIADGRVFVIDIENETNALDAKTGQILWTHKGIAESASLMGASSPAVRGDTVVVAYSSGEIFGLRTQNGRVVWSEVLAMPTQKGALPAIADIVGLPVLDRGQAFAISHSGRMAAIDERTGDRQWETDLGGRNTPCVGGNAVYVLTNDSQLVALSRMNGRIVWITELRRNRDASDRSSKPVSWFGPVLAGGRLWLTNSLGQLAAYAPDTGYPLFEGDVDDAFFMPPVVASRTMVLLTQDGDLIALR